MRRFAPVLLCVVLCSAARAAPVEYTVTLASSDDHLVHVRMHLDGTTDERVVQLPVWNALYQIRDFVQNVSGVRAYGPGGRALAMEKTEKSAWRIRGARLGVDVEYDVHLDMPGPFGAQFNSQHVFFNFALLLMYAPDARQSPVTLTLAQVPANWRIATALARVPNSRFTYAAENYDRLVDSPMEVSSLRETSFQQDGAVYRIAVHADPADYKMEKLISDIRKIVVAAVAWMDDRPFSEYLFIYHFPHGPGRGGMEHAYSTAIEVSAERLVDDPRYFNQLTAHEFLHLWNVKRIRPATLEPVDYTRENYTRALWFSEGVTTTAAMLVLVRAGLANERDFLAEFEREIRSLQLRPAHRTQSAEEASLDCWLEKYPLYRLPARSISYYNKGEVLGFLLDLEIRRASKGSKSLRDLFRWMNQNYAKKALYFKDSEGVLEGVEKLTGTQFDDFFKAYVAGVAELPYDQLLATMGLRLQGATRVAPVAGFQSVRNFDSPPMVVVVESGSEAEKAGLVAGDSILEINGKHAVGEFEDTLFKYRPGETLKLRVGGRKGTREVKINLGSRVEEDFRIVEAENVTAVERTRRAAWLASEPEPPSVTTPN